VAIISCESWYTTRPGAKRRFRIAERGTRVAIISCESWYTTRMTEIVWLHAREVLDSRGNPTVEAEIGLDSGALGRAIVPSGASTGEHEALELRDGDAKRWLGKGVGKAIDHVRDVIAPTVIGMDASDQAGVDAALIQLDGTPLKSHLGANAILSVSMAVARAAAAAHDLPLYRYLGGTAAVVLPVPLMNIINGGAHADNNLDIQEFMIAPAGFDRFEDALRAGVETFHHLKKLLASHGKATNVGDEGGFAPSLDSADDAMSIILEAIGKAGYEAGKQIYLALDVAASELYDKKKSTYTYAAKAKKASDLIDMYAGWVEKYPIVSIEDGLAEDDWGGWKALTERLDGKVQIVGDDLFVTQVPRLKRGLETGTANSILVKLNQVGSVSETLDCVRTAQHAGYTAIISHRSGETEDAFIADLAVATCAGQIKTGSASRSDRVAKYNQLLRIADQLGDEARFAGSAVFKR
jgi:enolase